MYSNRTILTELLFRLVYLSYKINKSITRFRNSLLGPVCELELSDCPRRPVSGVGNFKFSQNILRHVVFGDWIDYETLVSYRSIAGPVLMAFFLKKSIEFVVISLDSKTYPSHFLQLRQHNDDGGVVFPEHPPQIVGGIS